MTDQVLDTYSTQWDTSEIVVLHVPKTAGSSLVRTLKINGIKVLELHLSKSLGSLPPVFLRKIESEISKPIVVTCRDPLEHVVSSFFFYQSAYKKKILSLIDPETDIPPTFEEFMRSKHLQNMQVSFLCHNKFLNNAPTEACSSFLEMLSSKKNVVYFSGHDDDYKSISQGLKRAIRVPPFQIKWNMNKISVELFESYREECMRLNNYDAELWSRSSGGTKTFSPVLDTPPVNGYPFLSFGALDRPELEHLSALEESVFKDPMPNTDYIEGIVKALFEDPGPFVLPNAEPGTSGIHTVQSVMKTKYPELKVGQLRPYYYKTEFGRMEK